MGEYGGMNDPMWDLADFSVEAGLSVEADGELLSTYCDGQPSPSQYGRFMLYKAMCDLLWTLWGLIQHANGNPAEDFWEYSVNRFVRCRALMTSESFDGYVSAVMA